jgi:uncharacterized protein YbjQ (UPF0145 family)
MTGKKDLTRIEDLSEFIHQDDEESDNLFATVSDDVEDPEELPSLDDLEENEDEFNISSDEDMFSEKTSLHDLVDESEVHQSDQFADSNDEDNEFESQIDSNPISFGDEEDFELSEEEVDFSVEPVNTDFDDQSFSEAEPDENIQPAAEVEEDTSPPLEHLHTFTAKEPAPEITPPRVPPEKFDDIRQFGESIVYGKITAGGNPPYSVMIQNIKFQEDAEDIAILLREIGLLNNENEQAYTEALKNGALLVSQLGEYAAIYLAHKLRRFDLDLRLGLSEEIHPSKNYETNDKGLIRKENLRQNKQESVSLQEAPQRLEHILVMTANTPEGYRIHRYLGVVTSHRIVDEQELVAKEGEEPLVFDDLEVKELADHHWNRPSPSELYQDLSLELRQEAMKLKANAVIGITYSLTPLLERDHEHEHAQRYKVTCTGNAAWLSGLGG